MHFGLGAVVEDEVVALAVSPGLADGEVALAGLIEEGGFGALAGALGVGAAGIVGRVIGWWRVAGLRHGLLTDGRRGSGVRPALV